MVALISTILYSEQLGDSTSPLESQIQKYSNPLKSENNTIEEIKDKVTAK